MSPPISLSRRSLLRVGVAVGVGTIVGPIGGCGSSTSSSSAFQQIEIPYGSDPQQRGELRRVIDPRPAAMVVLIHGGYWQQGYGRTMMNDLALDLNRLGYTTWNLDYRQVGDAGGGWPGTFDDVADGIDHVRSLARDYPIDTTRVAFVGHSAGGQLAIWACSRATLPAGSPGVGPSVAPMAAISLAGVLDMESAATTADSTGASELQVATTAVMGGTPGQVPDRYAVVSPLRRIPVRLPQLLVHGDNDTTVPISQSQTYATAAIGDGDQVELTTVAGAGHFDVIRVGSPGWDAARSFVENKLGPAYPAT